MLHHPLLSATALVAAAGATSTALGADGYMNHDALTAAVQELAAAHASCRLDLLGSSRQGRGLLLLTLSDQPERATVPALLITAGLDGRHLVGTETALRVARRLLEEHADVLEDVTVYVVPRLNPDAAEANLGAVNAGHIGTFRVTDDDHDGAADEDGPFDLNGDGLITMMRRLDPPLDDAATHLPDPAEPRLLKEAEAAKGEHTLYAVYTEGLDRDADGRLAEDGEGAVDLDRNFMHRWPEYDAHAGPYPLSEPEAAAMARFVLGHPNIMAAAVYGRHDNLISVPEGKKKDVTGRAPVDVHADDVAMYQEIAARFKEVTEQKRAPEEDGAGALHAWLYAQRGIPTFATVVWGRPDATSPAEAEEDEGQDGEDDADRTDEKKEEEPADEEAAAWLEYSDRDRGGAGFVEWTPFDHPTLGAVEIGGFVPAFRMNPPADVLDAIAERQTAFVLDLLERSPRISFEGPTTKRLGDGLYEVRFGIVNEGYFPTATAMARTARSRLPTVVRLSTPLEDIVAGERVSRHWGIDGSGGRAVQHWIIRAKAGTTATIEIVDPQLGTRTIVIEI